MVTSSFVKKKKKKKRKVTGMDTLIITRLGKL